MGQVLAGQGAQCPPSQPRGTDPGRPQVDCQDTGTLPFLFLKPTLVESANCVPGMAPDPDLAFCLLCLALFSRFWFSGPGRSRGCLPATPAMQPWPH